MLGPDEHYRVHHISEAEAVDEQAVIDFWEREGALLPETARERIAEVAFIAEEEPGRVVAVSTLVMVWSSRLRTDMWNLRAFVGRDHRRGALAIGLLRRTRQHLEQRFVSGVDTRAPGILLELENPEVKQARPEAVWEHPAAPGKRYVFIGENERKDHIRVHYFPGARAPLPDEFARG